MNSSRVEIFKTNIYELNLLIASHHCTNASNSDAFEHSIRNGICFYSFRDSIFHEIIKFQLAIEYILRLFIYIRAFLFVICLYYAGSGRQLAGILVLFTSILLAEIASRRQSIC